MKFTVLMTTVKINKKWAMFLLNAAAFSGGSTFPHVCQCGRVLGTLCN